MLYERAGSLQPEILTRAKEKHEYYRSCYKQTGKKNRKKLKKMPVDEEVWTPVTIDGVEYDIRVHPESRVPFVMVDGVPTPIPRDPDGKETIFHQKEKKFEVLWGERLKLYWLCDQGLKHNNNQLRIFQGKKMQKNMRKVAFKKVKEMEKKKEEVENQGQPKIFLATMVKSRQWYTKRYQDGNHTFLINKLIY